MSERLRGLVGRHMLPIVRTRMRDEPVVLLQGPRSVGKSTLLRQLAGGFGVDVIDLDDLATRDAVAADPSTFVAGPPPVCVDEYQHVPLLLDAIKAQLNVNSDAGRFVLTGSARHQSLPAVAQALTGRLHRLAIHPLSQSEIEGTDTDLLDRLFSDPSRVVSASPSRTPREEYIERVVVGGFPTALARGSEASRNRWFDDYIRLTLERDVQELSRIQQAATLPRLLERLASQTGQVLNLARAASDVRLNERTADSYLRLLEAVFLVHRLPAWGTTLTARSAATPKLHVFDSGIASRLLRLTPSKLARREPTALTELGHLLETFVVGELLKHASWLDGLAGVGHWRTRDGDEVDLVVERDDGAVVALEVKAAQRVTGDDLAPLRKLREAVGPAFVAGAALYLGPRSFNYEDRLYVLPVDRLWAP